MVERFKHEGLHQVQNCFVCNKDLRGSNVLLLQSSVLHEMLNITIEIWNCSHEPLAS